MIKFFIFLFLIGCGQFYKETHCITNGYCKDKAKGTEGKPGVDGKPGPIGPKGPVGSDGTDGIDGTDGQGCEAAYINNDIIITCADSTVVIYNNNSYMITEIIDPCGPEGQFDEVIFKTFNGTLIAHYSQGNKQFLTILSPGDYITTDGTMCHFTVSEDNEVI